MTLVRIDYLFTGHKLQCFSKTNQKHNEPQLIKSLADLKAGHSYQFQLHPVSKDYTWYPLSPEVK